ncbi:malate:quinone oxidoreductase [Glutamicibacter protophormiae]|uniref:Probable malate:quinone oxidoreductase n=1 Tax=Kocuria varians TaxID=1272 RepID=A0A7D7Q1B9_KOCVA|nr:MULTISPECIES: malate:quinone oxidoreductase [Kocuria]WNB89457.1 malate:quinone oxidoreductase [Glutamicibacter protophormiae]MDN5631731.1 malate:quinone oxidoreductase [Kocuria sp.]QMS57419.1 putative malate:quinone oxidoreductase 1 [Kocuria varians]RUP84238.1 malate:quinone oxidoreductase [Kocuria sp. HSID17590]RUQ11620.1 malate:quinone oxidoreductase [Kocuria sp. HSID17582]
MTSPQHTETADVVLVGAGIMSATLATLLNDLQPEWKLTVLERLDAAGLESSNAWNNAGTGHSALCELNYAPQASDGTVSATKALNINEQFQITRQLWSSLVENGTLGAPSTFINSVPHISMVFGDDHANYLRARYDAFKPHKLFERMEFTEDREQIAQWAPLTMHGRGAGRVAATFAPEGTDVDFGSLTNQLLRHLGGRGVSIQYGQQVTTLERQSDGSWLVSVKDRLNRDNNRVIRARFVFLGAGGGALPLLQKSGIKEAKGFGGFPVSGLFLRNVDPTITAQHNAKVYGQASVGAPPMSVPHLDTRYVDGERALMFGPYGGFRPNFLKQGSLLDLPKSVRAHNLYPMTRAGMANLDLVKYLLGELTKTRSQRIEALHEYYPSAEESQWELIEAGQRVQVMKADKAKGGVLQFGTELVTSADGSIGALLGASPGASTAVPIMLNLLTKCFPAKMSEWEPRIKELIPAYGVKLNDNPGLADEIMGHTASVLGIK